MVYFLAYPYPYVADHLCYLVDKEKPNFDCLTNCRYCVDRAQNLPEPAPNNVLTVLQILSKSIHCRQNETCEHRFCPIEFFHDLPEVCFASGE